MAHEELSPLNITPGAIRFNTDSMKLEYFRIGMEGGSTSSYAGIGTMAAGEWVQITTDTPEIQTGGTRGLFAGGNTPSYRNDIRYYNVDSTGNSIDFGDLTDARSSMGSLSSRTRGVFACGYSPGDVNTIDYVTISSTGNAIDFGDNAASGNNGARYAPGGVSNATRGLIGGGQSVPGGTQYLDITYITIAQTGNSVDFGDLVDGGADPATLASSTRGIFAGGVKGGSVHNTIEYVTISTLGNAANFGDLNGGANRRARAGGASNSIRGVIGGIYTPSATSDIDYITIATLGNAQDFGDMLNTTSYLAACSSPTRCVWAGGYLGGSRTDTIQYVQIMSTGDAVDFGNLDAAVHYGSAVSNGHGGLG